jgi:hypothetical protein
VFFLLPPSFFFYFGDDFGHGSFDSLEGVLDVLRRWLWIFMAVFWSDSFFRSCFGGGDHDGCWFPWVGGGCLGVKSFC